VADAAHWPDLAAEVRLGPLPVRRDGG
jgi:hypothetical protein